MPYFSHFNGAIEDLRNVSAYQEVRKTLVESEKFYLPDDIRILSGKQYTVDLKKNIRLPFDNISILQHYDEYPLIICATQLNDLENFSRSSQEQYTSDSIFFSVLLKRKNNNWIYLPHTAKADLIQDRDGVYIQIFKQEDGTVLKDQKIAEYYLSKLKVIANLCIMLSLHNVKTKRITPPKLLKRIHKKKNFYSYRVLNVNGDIWEKSMKDEKNPHLFRSHMRRGHIRRLPNGLNTWVSSCFVRGNTEGYVGKEYCVAR